MYKSENAVSYSINQITVIRRLTEKENMAEDKSETESENSIKDDETKKATVNPPNGHCTIACQTKPAYQNTEERHTYTRVLDILALIGALVATVALFTLPVIFHFVLQYSSSSDSTSSLVNTLPTSPSNTSMNTTSCTSPDLTWGMQSLSMDEGGQSSCMDTGYLYSSNGVCVSYLNEWQRCTGTAGTDSPLLINSTSGSPTQSARDAEISQLISFVEQQPASCRDAAVPFLCQYYFPLKDCTAGNVYTASQQTCLTISTSLCASLWNFGILVLGADRLPDCSTLPLSVVSNNSSANSSAANMTLSQSVDTPSFNITCSDAFQPLNSSCLPRCDKFDSNTKHGTRTLLTSEIVAVTTGLILCLLFIVFAMSNYKNMLTFPSVFLIFIVIDYISAAIVVIISALDRNGLYCGSTNLLENLQSPTFFCSFSGAVFHYALVGMTIWWFLHVAVFFYKVMFPFHAKQLEQDHTKRRCVFAVLTIFGIVFPVPSVVIILSTVEYKLVRYPPSICSPDGEYFFYTATLVINVLMCTGVCFLIVIFWIIHTNQHFHSQRNSKLNTAEKKILIFFMSYIVFGVFVLVQGGVVSAHSEELQKELTEYLACESTGNPQRECSREEFEKYTHPYLLSITYILLGLIPLSILIFVVNVRQTKTFMKKSMKTSKVLFSQTTSTSLNLSSRNGEIKSQSSFISSSSSRNNSLV